MKMGFDKKKNEKVQKKFWNKRINNREEWSLYFLLDFVLHTQGLVLLKLRAHSGYVYLYTIRIAVMLRTWIRKLIRHGLAVPENNRNPTIELHGEITYPSTLLVTLWIVFFSYSSKSASRSLTSTPNKIKQVHQPETLYSQEDRRHLLKRSKITSTILTRAPTSSAA